MSAIATLKNLLPPPAKRAARRFVDRFKIQKAGKAWRSAPETPRWLTRPDLETLQARYPLAPRMSYDPDSLLRRGRERYGDIMRLLAGRLKGGASLELGCGDGMVSSCLQDAGFRATAIDPSTALFDPRARAAGVQFHEMDAAALSFGDAAYDLVFCYNTFEHFAQPDRVLAEIHRVLKPGGYLVAVFNPIYSSPFGLHAYYSVSVPYAQFLFEPAVLDAFCADHGMEPINYGMLNEWTATMFRKLWGSYGDRFETLHYREQHDCSALDLVVAYPSCFRGKTGAFDDLYVNGMECFFRKRDGA